MFLNRPRAYPLQFKKIKYYYTFMRPFTDTKPQKYLGRGNFMVYSHLANG